LSAKRRVARHVGPQAGRGFGAGERCEADAPLRQLDEALFAQRVRTVPGAADEHALAALDAGFQLGEERQLGGQPARRPVFSAVSKAEGAACALA
jgi:hypothetical protein